MDRDEPEFIFNLPDDEIRQEPAPNTRRILALLIDMVIFYFLFFQIFFMIYATMAAIPVGDDADAYSDFLLNSHLVFQKMISGVVASTFILLFYFIVSEHYLQASFGEYILKLKVISADSRKMTFRQLIIRNLTKSVLILFIFIDWIPVFFTPLKQRYTELISRTRVIYNQRLELRYEGYA